MMQRFGALAAQRRIGGCILGVTPAEDTLCSMAIGYARAEDEPAFDVPALTVSMTQAIRRHLARRLPDYMLPQHITLIPEIPLSNNGKVDTSRLPKVVKHSECLAPRSDDEIRMRRLWAELLDKREERIGCDQSFFTQGGIRFWLCDWYARSASRREPRCVWKTSTTTIRFRKWRRGSPGNLVATAEKKGRCNDVDGFIEQPEKNNILLWAKADDRLGFSVDKDIGFDADLKAEVAARKDELLTLLQDNGVTSEQLAKEKSFLRLPPSSWPLALDSIQQGMYLQSDIDGLPYTYTVPLFIGLPQVDIARLRNALQNFYGISPCCVSRLIAI